MGSVGKFKTKVDCSILDKLEQLGKLFKNQDRRRGYSVSSGFSNNSNHKSGVFFKIHLQCWLYILTKIVY